MIGDPPGLIEPFDAWASRSSPLSPVIDAFRSNLVAAATVGSLPYKLISSAVQDRHFDHLYTAERIRGRKDLETLSEEERDKQAYERAASRASSQDYQCALIDHILSTLASALDTPDFSDASDELLRQVSVMAWGALEVLANDLGTKLINARPALAKALVDLNSYKQAGVIKGIPVNLLEEFNFDVSGVMGDIIFSFKRMDSISAIKEFCSAIFSNADLDRSLKSSSLWMLAQRRHLIVHRRGIVDNTYIQTTPDSQPLGSRISISAREVESSLKEVRDIGLLMAECADALLKL